MTTTEFNDSMAEGEDDGRDSPATDTGREAQLALLKAENQRLREESIRARQNTYRNAALALGAIGLSSVVASFFFPAERSVFITLGAIGLFAGALTYYLTPGQFVNAAVGEQLYAANAHNWSRLATELGLQSKQIFVPGGEGIPAHMFVPLYADYEIPTDSDRLLVLEEGQRGLLLAPTAGHLVREFHQATTGTPAQSPGHLAEQLTDALVEQFELVHQATPTIDETEGQILISVQGSAFGDLDRFDHPIPSFLGSGLAATLNRAVTVTTTPGDDRTEWVIVCEIGETPAESDEEA